MKTTYLGVLWLFLGLACWFAVLPIGHAQDQNPQLGEGLYNPRNWHHLRVVRADPSLVPYIQCHVCAMMSQHIAVMASKLYEDLMEKAPGGVAVKRDMELMVLDLLENGFCDPDSIHGSTWTPFVSVVPNSELGVFEFEIHAQEGRCGVTCRTAAAICDSFMDDAVTDLEGSIYKQLLRTKSVDSERLSEILDCENHKCLYASAEKLAEEMEPFVPLTDAQREASLTYRSMRAAGQIPTQVHEMIQGNMDFMADMNKLETIEEQQQYILEHGLENEFDLAVEGADDVHWEGEGHDDL